MAVEIVDFPIKNGGFMGFNQQTGDLMVIYPLVNVYITMERSTIFDGKIHYFDWAMFQLANY